MANKTLSFSLKIDGVKSQLSDLKELEKQLAEIKKKIKDINDVGMSKITDEESKLTVAINNTKKAIEERNKALNKEMSDGSYACFNFSFNITGFCNSPSINSISFIDIFSTCGFKFFIL